MDYRADFLTAEYPDRFRKTLNAFVAPVARHADAVAEDPQVISVANAVFRAFGDYGGTGPGDIRCFWWGLEARAGLHLGDALALAAVPFTLVFGVASYWAGRERQSSGGPGSSGEGSSGSTLAVAADQLAQAVQQQWEQEAGIRRLYDPYPLAVSWTAADPMLSDDWVVLERLAESTGWPAPTQGRGWAHCPAELAGEGDALESTLVKVPPSG